MCNANEDCTIHMEHGDCNNIDDYISFRVPVKRARRFRKHGVVDYRSMHKKLYDDGFCSRTRKTFIQNFHGLFDNCCTCVKSKREVKNRIERFIDIQKKTYGLSEVLYVCQNSYVAKAFSKLVGGAGGFIGPIHGQIICCINSIFPLIERSELYDYRRCVYHMTFPSNYNNSVLDRDPCSRSVLKEVYMSNFDKLVTQISLFFDRCAQKYFPKQDKEFKVVVSVNKCLMLVTDMNPDLLHELCFDVSVRRTVSIDVKRDILNCPRRRL